MTAIISRAAPISAEDWKSLLQSATRQEFQVDCYVPKIGDPVLFGKTCMVPICEGNARIGGMCRTHRQRWIKDGSPDKELWSNAAAPHRDDRIIRQCASEGCKRSAARSFCVDHLWRRSHLGMGDDEFVALGPVMLPRQVDTDRICAFPGCGFPAIPYTRRNKKNVFCDAHYTTYRQWRAAHKDATPTVWINMRIERRQARYLFTRMEDIPRSELQYVLQCRHDARQYRWSPELHKAVRLAIQQSGVNSILEWSSNEWRNFVLNVLRGVMVGERKNIIGFFTFALRHLTALRNGDDRKPLEQRDLWSYQEIGFGSDELSPFRYINFSRIQQPWARELVKRWASLRVRSGIRPGTLYSNVSRLSTAFCLIEEAGVILAEPSALTRQVLERLCHLVRHSEYGPRHQAGLIAGMAFFLSEIRRLGWDTGIPADAQLHKDEIRSIKYSAPRSVPEYLMSQIENEEHIGLLGHTQRAILRLLINTGLRIGDTMRLRVDTVERNRDGAPHLRFINHKFNREAVVPIAESLAAILDEEARGVRSRYPDCRWMFPRGFGNPDGRFHYSSGTWKGQFHRWQEQIGLRDERGKPVRIATHQFRHTFATRLVNAGIPLDVVRYLLDHSSIEMTGHYARIYSETLRAEWEKGGVFVGIDGQIMPTSDDENMKDAAWALESLSRAKQTLTNGYCARPLQQDCEHPNACLTCPDFRTTRVFLPIHRQQLIRTEQLIESSRSLGQERIVRINIPVQESLRRIIATLEASAEDGTE